MKITKIPRLLLSGSTIAAMVKKAAEEAAAMKKERGRIFEEENQRKFEEKIKARKYSYPDFLDLRDCAEFGKPLNHLENLKELENFTSLKNYAQDFTKTMETLQEFGIEEERAFNAIKCLENARIDLGLLEIRSQAPQIRYVRE